MKHVLRAGEPKPHIHRLTYELDFMKKQTQVLRRSKGTPRNFFRGVKYFTNSYSNVFISHDNNFYDN
jgi:hypothetical protein